MITAVILNRCVEGAIMNEEQANKQLDVLIGEIDAIANKSTIQGRIYYYLGYGLALISVVTSIMAGILALSDAASLWFVGVIALVPAFCATVAGQLRFVEKANWHYGRRRKYRTLARETRFARLKHPTLEVLEAAHSSLETIEAELDDTWTTTAAFSFAANDPRA